MAPSDTPRVGYVLKRYPRYSETFIVNEILAHERAGLDVEIFALRSPNDTHFQDAISRVKAPVTYLQSDGVKAAEFWAAFEATSQVLPGFFSMLETGSGEEAIEVFQAAVLAREASSRGITHLHAHFATSATSVARLAAKFSGIPYTFTAHAKDIFHQSVCQNGLRRKLLEAKAVITVSDFNLQFLRRTYDAAASRVERVYNGLDLKQFRFQSPISRQPHIVSVGRLVEKKGFAVLAEACSILKARGVEFSCTIVGTGPLESELRRQLASLDLNSLVQLVGPRPQREVIELVHSACAIAAPCIVGEDGNRDGLPTVLLEAMALGTPCVSTDVTGIPEILRNDQTGLMVRQHDAAGLAAALERLLSSPRLRDQLATSARRLIESDFDVDLNAAKQRELFIPRGLWTHLQEVA